MVRLFLLREAQRKAIIEYLENRPNVMPPKVRGIRRRAKTMDFKQIRADADLLEILATIEVMVGRKRSDYAKLQAELIVRHKKKAETKGTLTVKKERE